MKKARQFDFAPTIAGRFLLTLKFIHSQLLHHKYDQNYYISINSAYAYFLVRPFSCFPSTSKYSCIYLLMQNKALMKTYRKLDTKTKLLLSYSAGFSIEYCSTLPVQHLIAICDYCFLVGISYVQETQQSERY